MKQFVPLIARAMREPDTIVLRLVYEDEDGVRKRRYISPISFHDTSDDSMWVMCLSDGDLKHFKVERCSEVVEFPSHLVFMLPIDGGPMPVEVLGRNDDDARQDHP